MKDYENFVLENYETKEVLVKGTWANIFTLLIFIFSTLLFGSIYYLLWGNPFQGIFLNIQSFDIGFGFIYLVILVGFILLQENMYGMIWSRYTDVKINIIFKSITRICYCEKIISIKHYIIGLIIPPVILGIIPSLIGILIENIIILGFGLVMLTSGSLIFYYLYLFGKIDKSKYLKDMDSKIGFIVYNLKS